MNNFVLLTVVSCLIVQATSFYGSEQWRGIPSTNRCSVKYQTYKPGTGAIITLGFEMSQTRHKIKKTKGLTFVDTVIDYQVPLLRVGVKQWVQMGWRHRRNHLLHKLPLIS